MMRQKIFVFVTIVVFFGMLYQTGCKNGDDCTFDITGSWQLSFVFTGNPVTFGAAVTFSGATASGTATGFNPYADMIGTYTVTGCTTVSFSFPASNSDLWTFNGSSTSDIFMSGTFTYYDDSAGTTQSGTWTGNKL